MCTFILSISVCYCKAKKRCFLATDFCALVYVLGCPLNAGCKVEPHELSKFLVPFTEHVQPHRLDKNTTLCA